ncbi:hypothetical protein J5X84_25905 [Streptosporangiaceae bacterium NEAU-GS5]|nr:hypothetical protein [Streptosporangiaceae bacterium NEAU-GS5]
MRGFTRGALGGVAATTAMSALMVAGRRAGLMSGQPPKHVARAILPGHPRRPKPGEGVLGAVAHYGFGVSAGALFGLLIRSRRAPVSLGVAYALVIWVVSYQGWVPRVTVLPEISKDRPGRPAVMAAGHVVYGAVLAAAMNLFAKRRRGALSLDQRDDFRVAQRDAFSLDRGR